MSASRFVIWIVWLLASIFYAYQYILRVMPNIMYDDIISQFQIDATIFGQLSGIYYIAYSLVHLPIGVLLDRFGPKKVMPICILLMVIGLMPIIFAENWIYPLIGRALMGVGSSAAAICLFKIIRMIFAEKHFSRMLSFSVTIGLVGAIYAGGPLSDLCNLIGYQNVVRVFAIMGVVLSFLTYWIMPYIEKKSQARILSDVKEVLSKPNVIFLSLFAGLMVGPLEGFADAWGSQFLKEVYSFDDALSSRLPSHIFVGMCFGGPILSLIAEKTGCYMATLILAGFVMTIGFFALISGEMSAFSMNIVFILIGMCCAYQILALYKVSTYVRDEIVGLTTAISNMIIMSFGYFFHTMIGFIVSLMNESDNSDAFIYGIAIIPIALSIGVVGLLFMGIKEKMKIKKAYNR